MRRILAKLWEDKTGTFSDKEKAGLWLGIVIAFGLCIKYAISFEVGFGLCGQFCGGIVLLYMVMRFNKKLGG